MNYSMQSKLKEFVSREGKNELFNENKLRETFSDIKYQTELYRLLLVLSCEIVKDYVLNAEKQTNRVELNNLIMSVVRETGLKTIIVKESIAMICNSIGINFNYELVTAYDPIKETFQPSVNTLEPEIIQKKLDAAQAQKNSNNFEKAAEIYEELVKAGSRAAMYQLGMMYINEEKSISKGIPYLFCRKSEQLKKGVKLLEMAAENGHTKARVELGNYYYLYEKRPDSLKKAYALYSSPGIPSTNLNIKAKLIDIFNQEKTNYLVTVLGGILLLFMWVFLFLCNSSVHHNTVEVGWGILLTILPTLIYGLMCFLFYKFKYVYIKVCIFAMLLIWLIYPLILAIN